MNIIIPLVLLSVLLNTLAQIAIKVAMNRIGHFAFSLANFWPIAFKVAFNPFFIGGLSCYVLSLAVWLLVLSRTQVSLAYPMASLGYITTAVAAYWMLGENLSLMRLSGIFIIILGVCILARS